MSDACLGGRGRCRRGRGRGRRCRRGRRRGRCRRGRRGRCTDKIFRLLIDARGALGSSADCLFLYVPHARPRRCLASRAPRSPRLPWSHLAIFWATFWGAKPFVLQRRRKDVLVAMLRWFNHFSRPSLPADLRWHSAFWHANAPFTPIIYLGWLATRWIRWHARAAFLGVYPLQFQLAFNLWARFAATLLRLLPPGTAVIPVAASRAA